MSTPDNDPTRYSGPSSLDNPDFVRALNAYADANALPDVCPACQETMARDEELRYCVTEGCPLNPFEAEARDADGN